MVGLFLAAHGLMALGFTAVGVSLVTSVLTTRAPGMTMRRVPFFAFSVLVFGIGLDPRHAGARRRGHRLVRRSPQRCP